MIEFLGLQIGTFSQLLSSGFLAVILGFLVRNRKVTVDANDQLRDHFSTELQRLAERADTSDERHLKCEEARQKLREEIGEMHDELLDHKRQISIQAGEIDGLKRQILRYSTGQLLILEEGPRPSEVAPRALEAARRVKENGDK